MPHSSIYDRSVCALRNVGIALLLCAICRTKAFSQTPLYPSDGDNAIKLNALITMKRASLSGVCALRLQNDTLTGIVFNEFGISALSFQYKEGKKRAKILGGLRPLRRPIVRRIIGRDLALCLQGLAQGDTLYINTKQNIRYEFSTLSTTDNTDHATAQ